MIYSLYPQQSDAQLRKFRTQLRKLHEQSPSNFTAFLLAALDREVAWRRLRREGV